MARTVLFVMTGSNQWTLKDGTKHPTGFWAEEAVAPFEIFRDAGLDVTVATPGGVRPPVDEGSLSAENAGSAQAAVHFRDVIENAPEFQNPIALSAVNLADFDAVFVPGGHGPMEDLAVDADAGTILTSAKQADLPVGIVCHGPAILLSAVDSNGQSLFAGKTVTAFTNVEEQQAGLADQAPWLLQDRLTDAGLKVLADEPWAPHIETDGSLFTGQNPASSAPLATALVERLGKAN